LAFAATDDELEELFKGAGFVQSAEIVTNSRTQQSKGFGFVEMSSVEEAKRAVEILHDEDFMGRRLRVSAARNDGPREEADEENSSAA
ncbi:MAG: RNA-binding protein, partial [Verrucomicrobiota bacterium]